MDSPDQGILLRTGEPCKFPTNAAGAPFHKSPQGREEEAWNHQDADIQGNRDYFRHFSKACTEQSVHIKDV